MNRIFSREEAEQHKAEWTEKFGEQYDVVPILHATIEALAEALKATLKSASALAGGKVEGAALLNDSLTALREKGWLE